MLKDIMRIFIQRVKEISLLLVLAGSPLCNYAQDAQPAEAKQEKGVLVTGTVVDAESGIPLPGINVSVPGFSADLTDMGGNFSINVPSTSSTIKIGGQGSGYQTKNEALKGRTSVNVVLFAEPFNSFYDVVKLPNDVEKQQSEVVSAAKTIRPGEEKWRVAAESPENYLQGQVPGLNIIRRSGSPGAGADITLRGYSSLYTTNRPLIVVDGMIYDMADHGNSLISSHVDNPLNYIDIKDIENISVLKDASSMYGSKGANGAILITTSRAEELATRIDFSSYAGVNLAPQNLPVLEAEDYRVYLTEVLKSSGLSDREIQSLSFMSEDPNQPGYYNFRNNTDWQREVFENSYSQNYYLNVRGGDNIARYALSLGYLNSGGVVKDTDFNRYITRFNANLNMSPKLKVDANMAFSFGEQNITQQGLALKSNPIYLGLVKAPIFSPRIYSDAGVLSPNLSDVDTLNIGNPSQLLAKQQAISQSYRFFGSVNGTFEITKDLSVSSRFGITNDKVQESFFIPRKGVLSDTLPNGIAENRMGTQVLRTFALYNDTRLSYVKTLGTIHDVQANIGARYLSHSSESDFGLGFNSATDELRSVQTGQASLRSAGGDIGEYKWINYYAGVNYSMLNKYFLTFNVAADASSRFGREAADGIDLFGTKFGVFPSVGAGWLVSSEDFMAGVDAIELLKLRATYSITGNDDIGNYTSRQYYVGSNLLGIQGLVRGNIANPALQWETHTLINAGMDLALWNERVRMSVDVFRNETTDMLIREELPNLAGFDYLFTNNGEMVNSGIELGLNSRVINTNDVKWDLGLNIATYRNEITALPGNQLLNNFAGATILTRVGDQANLFYGYETEGVFASDADNVAGLKTRVFDGTLKQFGGGDVKFVDQNADGIINEADRVVIGNPNPDFTGLISSNFTYKRISLFADFTFSQGNDVYNYTRSKLESMSGFENQTQAVLNRWRTEGQVTDVPRASFGDPLGNSRFSDRWIEDGSYLRLRRLSLSYNLPITNNEYFKYASVYVTGNNLLTFTNYLGYDPEFSASQSVFGQGIDLGLVPQFTSVLLGVRIGF